MFAPAGARVYVNFVQHDLVVPSRIGSAAEALIRDNTVWLPEWLPAAFRAPPKTHKRPTFPLVTTVGREGLEPPTPCASWNAAWFHGVLQGASKTS